MHVDCKIVLIHNHFNNNYYWICWQNVWSFYKSDGFCLFVQWMKISFYLC